MSARSLGFAINSKGLFFMRFLSSFRDSSAYVLAEKIKGLFGEVSKEVRVRKDPHRTVLTLSPKGTSHGRVLFSYIIDAFLRKSGSPISNAHTNFWQSFKMAETFMELGYEVDVIHWTNDRFMPQHAYSFFVDVRHNLERLTPLLNNDCVKIMHLDTASMLFQNAAEASRLLALQARRGVTLRPRRFEKPNYGMEYADYATAMGNDFTVNTFHYAKKKIFRLPSPCAIFLDWIKRDWSQCRKQFFWFSSGSLVHKGLDLALEAFRDMPECQLIVCAPVDREPDFVAAYYKELYETPNIFTMGLVDIESQKFRDIIKVCGAMLNLSCSEGGGASVKTCMHAGLIPVVSRESAVDVQDFGFMLNDCSPEKVVKVVGEISRCSPGELEKKSLKAWEFARRHYTRENFAIEYHRVISEIIKIEKTKKL